MASNTAPPTASNAALQVAIQVDGGAGQRRRLAVDLAFGLGVTAIVGPSGAGKSTLLSAIAGLVPLSAGSIWLQGVSLDDVAAGLRVAPHRRGVGLVFQSLALFPHLSVQDNVAYGIADRRQRGEEARAWLRRVRAEHLAERRVPTLSGGEAQRVALARALAAQPRALLLDEPFSALDRPLRAALVADLGELLCGLAIPTLLVTHEFADVAGLTTRVVALEAGAVESIQGPAAALATAQAPR